MLREDLAGRARGKCLECHGLAPRGCKSVDILIVADRSIKRQVVILRFGYVSNVKYN
jgi:hypothetical protein